ncbi:MAG: hypothetical protein ABI414_07350 [Devosia sp.]
MFYRIFDPLVVGSQKVWQFKSVKKRIGHRWFAVLGLIAMLGAVTTMPLTATYAMTQVGAVSTNKAMGDMPCHKTPKHCPDCPQKVCPELGTCLVKCFQSPFQPVAGTMLQRPLVTMGVLPAPPQVAGDSLVPPLLRPPSV